MTAAIFDRQHFAHMTGADRALQREVLGLFRGQAENWAQLLDPANPPDAWRGAAHMMKGSARGLGLWALAAACEEAETLGREAEPEAARVAAALAAVRVALAEALAALSEDDAPH
jgi:HPt (histidine-containing phosphotransfer) domain-containing protein